MVFLENPPRSMFDGEIVALLSGTAHIFHRSCRSGPALAASCVEIALFPQFQACVIAISGVLQ